MKKVLVIFAVAFAFASCTCCGGKKCEAQAEAQDTAAVVAAEVVEEAPVDTLAAVADTVAAEVL
ncbi:MAG: hypothetical protein IJU35_00490 [Paludibacteraceae bacterium]|nr:hypothetical protein [Paludibacteraceae bacterium]